MTMSPEHIFSAKQQLQTEIDRYEQQLHSLVSQMEQAKKIETLAQCILTYNEIERQIEDRSKLFSLFSSPEMSWSSPYVKAELFEYIVAAETVGPEFVSVLMDDVLEEVREEVQDGELDNPDLITAEYKEHVLPGMLIARRFHEVTNILDEMNKACVGADSAYNPERAHSALVYAFRRAIDADIALDPIIHALKEWRAGWLTEEDRAELLDHVEERLAIIRFETAKNQNIAMEQAIGILEKQEEAYS